MTPLLQDIARLTENHLVRHSPFYNAILAESLGLHKVFCALWGNMNGKMPLQVRHMVEHSLPKLTRSVSWSPLKYHAIMWENAWVETSEFVEFDLDTVDYGAIRMMIMRRTLHGDCATPLSVEAAAKSGNPCLDPFWSYRDGYSFARKRWDDDMQDAISSSGPIIVVRDCEIGRNRQLIPKNPIECFAHIAPNLNMVVTGGRGNPDKTVAAFPIVPLRLKP